MNMAARMESTGAKYRIHISSETAELLRAAGKERWIEKRDEMIDIKGKGCQNTYWVNFNMVTPSDANDGSDGAGKSVDYINETKPSNAHNNMNATKIARLVDWNVAVLTQRLQAIQQHHNSGEIHPKVIAQLKTHVEGIAHMYRKNPFHNFEVCIKRISRKVDMFCCFLIRFHLFAQQHASHVTMSCVKMLSRVTPTKNNNEKLEKGHEQEIINAWGVKSGYKDYTNDITDCPLTQFSVVYAALIHDCDHAGVSNDQLIKEGARIAVIYKNRSVAENHSFNLAFDFLMQPEFEDLLSCICGTENRAFLQYCGKCSTGYRCF
jgi:hypothetical protein